MRTCARLEAGDTIGIIAPAGPVKQDELEQGIRYIEARGYQVALGDHVLATMPDNSYLAGTDVQRAFDLNEMFARTDVKAVFSARGGYGSMRLYDRLDHDILRNGAKVFTGYSDITSLHLALTQQAGHITFYSPNVTSLPDLNPLSQEVFWKLLEKTEPYGLLPAPPDRMQTLVAGSVEGELAGGCLCLLAHACGSRHTPDFKNKIVLIEDINEAIYRVDRDLTQLRNAGALDEATGFILGSVSHWQKNEADPPANTLGTLWRDFFVSLGKPTISGFPFGHEPNPLTLPLGVRARLDADMRTVTLLEPAVR